MEITQTQIPVRALPSPSRLWALAAARLKVFLRGRSQRKALSVRETAALGDRRFVSVIQFERQRFLIGSSPSSVTLLAQLPDESASSEMSGEASREQSKEPSREPGKAPSKKERQRN